jgi:hypothetical protein
MCFLLSRERTENTNRREVPYRGIPRLYAGNTGGSPSWDRKRISSLSGIEWRVASKTWHATREGMLPPEAAKRTLQEEQAKGYFFPEIRISS